MAKICTIFVFLCTYKYSDSLEVESLIQRSYIKDIYFIDRKMIDLLIVSERDREIETERERERVS